MYIFSGAKTRKKTGNNRCAAHSLGLGSKKLLTFGHWTNTWKCMERECQEECVLIHFDLLRETIDRYLKKHSFCDECTKMVSFHGEKNAFLPNTVQNFQKGITSSLSILKNW